MLLDFRLCRPMVLMCLLWAAGCASTAAVVPAFAKPASAPAGETGFLKPEEAPDALVLIPPPPPQGSQRMAADVELYRESVRWRDTPRWRIAASDANLPKAPNAFSCAAGLRISQSATPSLYLLLQRVMLDGGLSIAPVKKKYYRPRPFALYNEPTCVSKEEAALRTNGSFPSGHAALGWAWALILAELVPERADALLARGYEFGQSRVVCGVHWQSDVDAGRMIASAVIAKLHANPEFVATMRAAREEVVSGPALSATSASDCAAEAAVFGAASALPRATP